MSASNVKLLKIFQSSIEFEHPAKAGHFPEQPVVPGVVVLEKVLNCAKHLSPELASVTSIETAKFHRALEFGSSFEIEFTYDTFKRVNFRCLLQGKLIAEGTLLAQNK